MEEGRESEGGPDVRIAKRLESVLQFVTDRAHELTPGRSTGVHEDAQEPVRAGQLEGHMKASTYALPALAFHDVHETVGRVDALDQTTEGCRPLCPLNDGGRKQRVLGAHSRNRGDLRRRRLAVDGGRKTNDRDQDDSGRWGHCVFLLARGGGKRGGNLETAVIGVEFAHYETASRCNWPAPGVAGRR